MIKKIKQIEKFLKGLLFFIVKHDFLAYLFILFLSLIFGVFLIYKYSILAQRTELGEIDQTFLIKEKTYQEVLEIWQVQEIKFREADFKECLDPFVGSVPVPEEGEGLTP